MAMGSGYGYTVQTCVSLAHYYSWHKGICYRITHTGDCTSSSMTVRKLLGCAAETQLVERVH